jgi:small-conductance mechanosensitive channel
MIDLSEFLALAARATRWATAEIRTPGFYAQLAVLALAAAIAWRGAAALRGQRDHLLSRDWPAPLRHLTRTVLHNATVSIFALRVWLAHAATADAKFAGNGYILSVAASLSVAWLIIRAVTGLIRNQAIVRLVAILAWLVAALSIVGLLGNAIAILDSMAIKLGSLRITPLLTIKFAILMALALWFANTLANFIETRVSRLDDLTPSVQVLIMKIMRLLLVSFAVVLVMGMAGIDLSALAIFSGAVGVGVGFGLQKIVANFVSGIILLADKSVKPGDLVTVGDSFGRVSAMNTRYISVAAGDGREFLIPNEDLVTQKVVNWTYRDKDTLIEVKFSASHEADPRLVCKLALDIAAAHPRAMTSRPAACNVMEFAESGIRFSLTFWIADPESGMGNVRSDVLLALWDAFRRENISIPSPFRDGRAIGGHSL